ncbi:helix-turn-helix domain-containing protein [Vallitalea sp.]|jgi:transcriptional regulator with XRE-family HTH domain|uniref:helix-turn-helix domain-containing protein n=1 Tax=Vallitalea sp. TaxID=1882829 RepID=UPI0025E26B6A|nr:helix-turn-helix transcriptional regulator [Vallitalea sp.]MCT4687510.1 helix-turn-helix domain-containing protein [Vallitalea sp.]
MIDYKLIGKRIKESRKLTKLTQENVSEILKVSPEYISRIETGKAKINLEMLVKVSNIFNISPAYLLTGIDTQSTDYLNPEMNALLKDCPPDKIKAISEMIKIIINL